METYFRHEKRLLSILSLLWEKVWINNCIINCEINRQLQFCIFSFMTETSLTFFLIAILKFFSQNEFISHKFKFISCNIKGKNTRYKLIIPFFFFFEFFLRIMNFYLTIMRGKLLWDINSELWDKSDLLWDFFLFHEKLKFITCNFCQKQINFFLWSFYLFLISLFWVYIWQILCFLF